MASERREPAARMDQSCFVYNDQLYFCRRYAPWCGCGRGYLKECTEDQRHLPLQRFDFSSAQWSGVSPVCDDQEEQEERYWNNRDEDLGVCCAVLGDRAYTFGGKWKYGYAVHELNLGTMVWRRLELQNREDGPMQKDKAGMVACGDEALCVFGGCQYELGNGRRQLGAAYHVYEHAYENWWTNELHLFHIKTGQCLLLRVHMCQECKGRSVGMKCIIQRINNNSVSFKSIYHYIRLQVHT